MKIMLVVSSKVKLIKNNHGYSIKIQTSFEKTPGSLQLENVLIITVKQN